jgi:DNA-directed RNA polymerase specialized sigma24 family protein
MSYLQEDAERAEARMFLRFAAQALTEVERLAIAVMMEGLPPADAAEVAGCAQSTIYDAQTRGLRKMREQLSRLGFTATNQLMST